jgi:spore coat protein CotH
MRNKLIFDLARDLGGYASRTEFVEVNINDNYKGLYVLMEKIKRNAFRVDINKLKIDENTGEDLTGGYILKIDKTTGISGGSLNELNSFTSPHLPNNATMSQTIAFQYEYPKSEDITSEQRTYISDYVTQFENALASDDFMDPDLGYNAYIDADSFVDFFLLNELSNNVDGYRLSTFMYKDKNEKLKMGPIWDFNLAFGNADYCEGGAYDVWAYRFNERCSEDYWLVPFWWDRLLQDPSFVAKVKTRWTALRGGVFAEGSIQSKLDGYMNTLDKAGALESNFETWAVLGMYIWPNNYIGESHAFEMGYMKSWIGNRLDWLDQAIGDL